jgi:hypothetical protein
MDITVRDILYVFLLVFGAGMMYSGLEHYVPAQVLPSYSILIGVGLIIVVICVRHID